MGNKKPNPAHKEVCMNLAAAFVNVFNTDLLTFTI